VADIKSLLSRIASAKGDIAIKRISLKVGVDLTKVISGMLAVDPGLETKVMTAVTDLGFSH